MTFKENFNYHIKHGLQRYIGYISDILIIIRLKMENNLDEEIFENGKSYSHNE